MAGHPGTDAFEKACQREHQVTMSGTNGRSDLLDKAEAQIKAGHSLSNKELEKIYRDLSTHEVQDKLDRFKKVVADGLVQRTERVDPHAKIAELEQELKRRTEITSKSWLAQSRIAQDAQKEQSPIVVTGAENGHGRRHSQERHMSANKGRPNGSVGNKQVAAALQGSGKGLFITPQNRQKKARINTLQFQSSGGAGQGTPMQQCVTCKKSVPVSRKTEGANPFLCHECIHVDGMATRSIKGKGKAADQTVEKDPFADLEEISDLGTGDTTADEAGPSSLPLKENLQPATERISAHTRGGQQRRPDLCPDLLNTRTIAEPSLKGQLSGSAFEGRLRSAAPKEGTQPEAFYGLGRGASTQQLREDSPAPPRRQSTRGQKRKAEQSNEPITLDDSEEEEGAVGADQAQAAPRRTTRSTAYKGPADTFKGLKALYPEDGGPGAVEVVPGDLVRLQPGEFLNDTIIDFYMRWIWQRLPEATQKRCYFFNSFFYKKLSEKQAGVGPLTASGRCEAARAAYERVRKWTKGVDIFEKDFLILPIHDHLHWSLVIICHPGVPSEEDSCTPWILHLDSMTSGHGTSKIRKELLAYLTQEWDQKVTQGGESRPALWAAGHQEAPMRKLDIGVKRLALPLQDNYCDCGLFLLTYTDYFTHSLPAAIRTKNKKTLEPRDLEGLSSYPLFMQKHWFQPDNAGALRAHIKTIILELFLDQVPEDQKETLAEALTLARMEIEEYKEDSQVPKYMSPAEYECLGQVKQEALKLEREEKAAKAARDKADKAASKEVERAEKRAKGAAAAEKRLSQGRIDISNEEVPRVSDTEDEGEGRPALRSGARRLGSAPPSSNGSGDIEVDLEDEATPSATPVRQLRSPAERSPTAKAVAAMAEKLQLKDQEAALASGQKRKANLESRKRNQHVIDDGEDTSAIEVGGTPEPGQVESFQGLFLRPEYRGRFKGKRLYSPDVFQVADVRNCSTFGPLVLRWHSFETEAASKGWMDSRNALDAAEADMDMSEPMYLENFQDCTVYHPGRPDEAAPITGAQPAPPEQSSAPAHGAVVTTGGSHLPGLPGLVDDGPEDLTADDGPEPPAEQIPPPDLEDDQILQSLAGFNVLPGATQPSQPPMKPCPEYINTAAASKSAESLAQADAAAAQLQQGTLAGITGAQQHTGEVPQQLGSRVNTTPVTAQQHHTRMQRLLCFLKPSKEEPPTSAEPQKVYQRNGKHKEKRQKSCADWPELETSSEAAQGGDCTARGAEDSHIDLTSDCEAPAEPAASGRATAPLPSRKATAPEAEANRNSRPPAQQACSPKQSREAKVDCSDRHLRQGNSESRHEHMESKTQSGSSPPIADSSQVPVSDCAGDSTHSPIKKESRHKKDCPHRKECWHKRKHQKKPERVHRPESVEKVRDDLCNSKLQTDKVAAASAAAPGEDATWRTKKRSATSSPPEKPRRLTLAPQIRSEGRASDRLPWDDAKAQPWHTVQQAQPTPVSQYRPRA